ncbi:ATP-grasp domain-containing protein [Allomesorhizobium alhagi]|jgi:tetrahydromethanopterin:alpha-L-glutamate ligase|uniref:RimK family alpha-L-glutamate ligase n=1 Tax=Mesorhizobium alhagi CCNWXJ12-2 TaxID=1107882 RepID=H0HRA7_9HYPH|nr:RimK family alpha-L-glutamate ligase [Mesorhizobium alhagi]EHK56736.1 RimK family alpha-L-glutamate ligase [Mesorhizobium alhagi CCNWXJ12-2]
MIPRILIVSDMSDARSQGLATRLAQRGAFVATAPLAAIAFDTGSASGLAIPGFDGGLPDAVIVRSIAAGSFEAITRRLGVLHALGRLSVPVWNSAQAIERCVDKSMTTFLLENAGLPTPPTFCVEGFAAAEEIASRELPRTPLVLKPLFGAQGRGIRLIRELADLPPPEEVNDVYYLQHYIPRAGPPFRDFRVFVCAGKAVAMMSRRGEDWITNVNRGAAPEQVSAQSETALAKLAVAAAAAVGADFAGVDIIPAPDGALLVLEVNSMPAWSGLQSVVAVNIADAIADALLRFLADTAEAASTVRPHRLVAPANS